ncbi:MAG: SpoIIE family protein phosphatase, partial [Firmicutes bacterium]|nr:SpoIIE family protein phosphatase [Bacillota bacterium]
FLFTSVCFGSAITIFVAVSVGVGASFYDANLSAVGVFVLVAAASVCFKNPNRFFAISAMTITFAVCGFYFNALQSFGVVSIIMLLLGSIAFVFLPKKLLTFFAGISGGLPSSVVSKSAINRNREGVCRRLVELSGVFGEMERVYKTLVKGTLSIEDGKLMVAQQVVEKVCEQCPDRIKCSRSGSGNELLECFCAMALAANEKGKATFLDVPSYLVARCSRLNTVLAAVNQMVTEYKQYNSQISSLDAGKVLMGNQLSGVSRLMLEIADELKKNIYFDADMENNIKEELNALNILVIDCILYRADIHRMYASLLVKECDSKNALIVKTVSKLVKHKMIVQNVEDAQFSGHSIVNLISCPKYNAAFGVAHTNKTGVEKSGDSYSILKLGTSKYMIAICDGMGSGERAERASNVAITLVENFYKAGFCNSVILNSVNGLLTLTQEDVFTALDICVIDMDTSAADFIKVGAPYGFVKRQEKTEMIEAGSLPLGVLEEMEPKITKTMVSNKDVIYLLSDGITDAFGTQEALGAFINSQNALNPQWLADQILSEAIRRSGGISNDDMTCVVARIFLN